MKEDIFKKAAISSQRIKLKDLKENPSTELVQKTADFSSIDYSDIEEKEVETFDDFKYAMEHEHAVKFHKLLKALPPAQFMDKYLKALEFVKPKIIRSTGDQGKKRDNKVRIIINKNKTA